MKNSLFTKKQKEALDFLCYWIERIDCAEALEMCMAVYAIDNDEIVDILKEILKQRGQNGK